MNQNRRPDTIISIFAKATTSLVVLAVTTATVNATTFFTANPTTNSVDWTNYVNGHGGTVNSDVNFDAHPLGPLQGNFYSASDGVTLTPSGAIGQVTFGQGPGQANNFSTPLSAGEGPHSASNYLSAGDTPSSLTLSFATPVLAGGLFAIDYYDPDNNNPITISAFTGPNGTGGFLGIASSAAFNFQPNHLYFMGVANTTANIGSIVFQIAGNVADIIGIDDIRFATVPEPSAIVLGILGAIALAFTGAMSRRRRPSSR